MKSKLELAFKKAGFVIESHLNNGSTEFYISPLGNWDNIVAKIPNYGLYKSVYGYTVSSILILDIAYGVEICSVAANFSERSLKAAFEKELIKLK
jgi:hypothetical protein